MLPGVARTYLASETHSTEPSVRARLNVGRLGKENLVLSVLPIRSSTWFPTTSGLTGERKIQSPHSC